MFEQVIRIGVGLPGKVGRENVLAVFQNSLPWEKCRFKERLIEQYPERAIHIDIGRVVAAYGK